MRSDEIRASGQLAARTLTDTVSHVEQVQRAVAARTFISAPVSLPARIIHDVIATGVYTLIREIGLVAGMAPANLSVLPRVPSLPAGSTPRSNLALAVLNAILGDQLPAQSSPLAVPMAVRRDRRDVVPRRESPKSHFPGDVEGRGLPSRLRRNRGVLEAAPRAPWLGHRAPPMVLGSLKILATPLCICATTPASTSQRTDTPHLTPRRCRGSLARSGNRVDPHRSFDRWSGLPHAATMGTEEPFVGIDAGHVFYLGTPHLGAGLEQWVKRLSDVFAKLDEVGRWLRSSTGAAWESRISVPAICSTTTGATVAPDHARAPNDVPLIPWANHYGQRHGDRKP